MSQLLETSFVEEVLAQLREESLQKKHARRLSLGAVPRQTPAWRNWVGSLLGRRKRTGCDASPSAVAGQPATARR